MEIFKQTPCGLELGYSNLLFNFVVGTIKHQATGRQNAVVQGTDSYMLATPFPLFAEANQAKGMTEAIRYGEQVDWLLGLVFVKGYQTMQARTRNRLSPPAILNALVVSSVANGGSRFRSSADSRACLIGISDLLTDMPVRLARRHQFLLRRMDMLSKIR